MRPGDAHQVLQWPLRYQRVRVFHRVPESHALSVLEQRVRRESVSLPLHPWDDALPEFFHVCSGHRQLRCERVQGPQPPALLGRHVHRERDEVPVPAVDPLPLPGHEMRFHGGELLSDVPGHRARAMLRRCDMRP